ncbi:MAG TPA: hypothetical protein VNY73_07775, partial [Bacteroidia bacterium]|nr:hypothetical protein [Bacteroidia bacterium]
MKKTTLLLLIVFYVLCREGFSQSGKNNTQGISGTPGTISFNSKNSPQEPQDGNSTLGTTYSVDKCGLNYVQASRKITNRHSAGGAGSGFPCVLTISGIPATCSNIEKAYVWMVLSFTAADSAAPHITFTNPSAVTHTFVAGNIGTAPDKCWGEINTQVFRIDVTSAITGNGNYVLNSSDLSDNDVDGATLLITYSDVNAAYQGHMIIADGAMSTQNALGNLTYTIGGFSACAASTFCSAFVINSDFQIASHNSTLNGTTLPFTDNFYNYDVTTASSVTAGQSSSAFASTATGAIDCFALAIAGLYYQTTSCTTCPVPLTASTTFTNTSCGQNNGAAAANVSTANYAPYTYSWSPGGQTTQTATGLAPGVYTYTVKDASGCKTTTGTVSIGGSANITVTAAAASPSVCAGQSTLLTGSGAANYTWSANAGSATTATVSVTPAVATIYTVTGTSGGCLNTGTVSVGVKALPNASANTSGTIGCGGSTATVNGSSATPGATYSWSGPGIVAGGSTATATVNIQGVYTVTVTDPATGCANTATTSVTTSTAVPNASATTTGSLTCINNTVTINGNSTTAGVTYSWSGPAGYTSANQSNVVSVAGNYTLSVTDPSSGCNSLIVTTVSTNTAAPGANATTTGSLTCSSSTATVNAGSATSGVTYNWNGPGIISGGNTASATVNASGTYTVTVTDPGNGCTNTATTAVTSNTMVPSASAMGNGTITCANSTATVTANPTTGGVTYNWSGTGIFSGGNTANAIVNMAGMYTVTVTDPNNGCINTATAAITSNTVIPNAGATSTGTLTCTNNSVTL